MRADTSFFALIEGQLKTITPLRISFFQRCSISLSFYLFLSLSLSSSLFLSFFLSLSLFQSQASLVTESHCPYRTLCISFSYCPLFPLSNTLSLTLSFFLYLSPIPNLPKVLNPIVLIITSVSLSHSVHFFPLSNPLSLSLSQSQSSWVTESLIPIITSVSLSHTIHFFFSICLSLCVFLSLSLSIFLSKPSSLSKDFLFRQSDEISPNLVTNQLYAYPIPLYHLQQLKLLMPVALKISKQGSKFCKILNKPLIIAKYFLNLPKWRNFAKFGHTDHHGASFIPLPYAWTYVSVIRLSTYLSYFIRWINNLTICIHTMNMIFFISNHEAILRFATDR